MPIALIVLGAVCVIYDFILMFDSPATLLNTIFSFSHVWTAAGALLIFAGINRRRTGRYFWADWKKRTKISVLSLIVAGVAVSAVNLGFILSPRCVPLEQDADYVILLGGGIDKNGEISPTTMKRVKKAAEYLSLHKNVICVVSGGKALWSNFAEAPELKRQLEKAGIESERILIEDKALDTIQNFQFSCEILSDFAGKTKDEILRSRIIVVSNYFHLRRAERLASRMGFTDIAGIGIEVAPYTVPQCYLREIAAYVKLNLRILLTGKPTRI